MTPLQTVGWIGLAILCAVAFGHVVGIINPTEKVNGLWLIVAASCFYVLAYRFYGRFLARKVMNLDDRRRTPAHRLEDGTNFYPANKYILFGHHFAAIAGAGPLLGPILAAQFGYVPGFLWIVIGAVLAGAVQDFVILVASMRRNGRSLPEIAHAEIGPVTGLATAIAVLFIVIVALAGLGLAVVNALHQNAWGVFTIAMTIPIAFLMGIYLQKLRPGRIGEMSLLGVSLLTIAIIAGRTVAQSEWAEWFLLDRRTLVWGLAIYGFFASVLPVWMLLVPRDYLSTFMKLGVVLLLGIGVIVLAPVIEMPRTTEFIHGQGPIIPGALFPFLFITIACGAISGFHSLVSSGTTPKLIGQESQAMVGYGAMLLESFVGVIALVAACLLVPGDYFAINTRLPFDVLSSMGFPVSQIHELSHMVEVDVSGRPGGAVSLAVGMASIFSALPGMSGLMAYWYQFALLFEALFILTTIDAGTRVARYLVQELGSHAYEPLKHINWWPGVIGCSALVVSAWGYLIGTGSIATIWPMFGAANQLLGMLALCIATTILIKMNKAQYLWVTFVPMMVVGMITLAGCYELFHLFLHRALTGGSEQALTMWINTVLVGVVAILAVVVLIDSFMKWYGYLIMKRPYTSSEVIEGEGIQLPAGPCC
ncbi:MAG: carbon starvation protein A [Nitrospirales bacterium]|nr:carbon starvation protein A [Nitrospira sp.]MDR4500297.1 carbon starvation protein A [Nitrospirales bacterium]